MTSKPLEERVRRRRGEEVKEESSSWFGFHFTMFEDKTRASLFLGHN
jgi:hypothetical protein